VSDVFRHLFLAFLVIAGVSLTTFYFLLPHGLAIATLVALLVAVLPGYGVARWAADVVTGFSNQADRILDSIRENRDNKSELVRIGRALGVTGETLRHAAEELESSDRRRREFIANVSHELRTPLTAIQGYAETVLDDRHLTDQSREFLAVLQANARRMSRLTSDLLTLARLESSDPQLHFVQVPASELLQEALRVSQDTAAGKNLELVTEAIVPRAVMADRDAINQVFSNLIENAVKYSGANAGKVLIGAKEVEGGVEFYVQDFGIGIPAEHHERIFERFYRVDKARSVESGGTGLGLAIVKHVVLQHGGTVRMESQPGKGSLFTFTLPTAV